jgi:23S rRNA (cytosine1962-C5)-methyltransferase
VYQTLRLKKNEERRLIGGHLWVYSNEVDTAATPLSAFQPGELANLHDHRDRPLGTAYVNPHSLICARLISRRPDVPLDSGLIVDRMHAALRLRDRIFDRPWYRAVYGEADSLPGLVVDRFDQTVVVQLTTAGMDSRKPLIVEALQRTLAPRTVIFRNDTAIRSLEGLPLYVEAPPGAPDRLVVEENGLRFETSLVAGQKTGWYFDHRLMRARLPIYARGQRVLDVFSYVGAWGIQAAVGGAASVTCIDESRPALELLTRNAEINGVADRVEARRGDAFELLKALHDQGESFDVAVLDPPAFIKRRKDFKAGVKAYHRLNQLALRLIRPGGILISASCSFHLSAAELKDIVLHAGGRAGRLLSILEQGHQGPDHPIHPAIEETAYLKSFVFHVAASA